MTSGDPAQNFLAASVSAVGDGMLLPLCVTFACGSFGFATPVTCFTVMPRVWGTAGWGNRAFAFSTELILKLIGVGLASAILIDGILIRMVLLPAVMHLLGERAWWRPRGAR